jgi:hypothetical protein
MSYYEETLLLSLIGDLGLGFFVMKFYFEKSKWFDKFTRTESKFRVG